MKKPSLGLLIGLVWLLHTAGYAPSTPDKQLTWGPLPMSITLLFTGDNLLGGGMARIIEARGEAYPYQNVAELLKSADISFGNLESPITDFPLSTPGKSLASIRARRNFIFRASPSYSGRILHNAGFDIVSLANNHTMDYRAEGLLETLEELEKHQIAYVGGGRNLAEATRAKILEVNGIVVGFLAYSMVVPPYFQAQVNMPGINGIARRFSKAMDEQITSLGKKVDVVIVSLHWGKEGTYYPANYQQSIAHRMIESGADIVVGHHTHTLQGIEFYKGGLIAYSLGNFLFASRSARLASAILEVQVSNRKIETVRILPIWVKNGIPEPSQDESLRKKIISVNNLFGTKLEQSENGYIVATANR